MAAVSSLIVIVGETASGKSALALTLAGRHNGEIIAADSRTVYKGMDVGTAKPSRAEQARVPHHLIDVIAPNERFTAADFKKRATQVIEDIQSRGKLPIIVGGTGLYVDSVLYDFNFQPVDQGQRDPQNPRHLARVIESDGEASQRKPLRANTLVLGLQTSPDVLQARIAERVEQMFQDGLEREVQKLATEYAWDTPGLSAIGYQEFKPYFDTQQTIDETKDQIIVHTRQYAKRQRTWFKRSVDIRWCTTFAEAEHVAEAFLTTKDAR